MAEHDKYYEKLVAILNSGAEIPEGILAILEDIFKSYEERPGFRAKGGQCGLIDKSYEINVMGRDARDVAKQHQLPDTYDNCTLVHTGDGYMVEINGRHVGPAVAKTEGRKILSWLTRALPAIENQDIADAPVDDGDDPEDDLPYTASPKQEEGSARSSRVPF